MLQMTSEQAFTLGLETGRKQAIEEIIKLLGIDELIAKAIELHEEQNHVA